MKFLDYQLTIMGLTAQNNQISYYQPLNQWLLGATNGNQGQNDDHLSFLDYQLTIMGLTAQNMP